MNGHPLPPDFQAQTYVFVSYSQPMILNPLFFSSGYCQQMDTHLPTTTVREALLFSAKLRQPKSVPLAEKEA